MPIYEYEHLAAVEDCTAGQIFEIYQTLSEASLKVCQTCQAPVRKRISAVGISVPKSNVDLRDMGFTKLVKRDDGVYENVTRRDKESRYMERGKPESMPDLKRIIGD